MKFLGTGEQLDALEPFRPRGMASRILQMGDILEVAREAHRLVDEKQRLELEERMRKGQFGLAEFRELMEKISQARLDAENDWLDAGNGEVSKMLAGGEGEKEMRQISGMIDSMTPTERKKSQDYRQSASDADRRRLRRRRIPGQPTDQTVRNDFSIMQAAASGNIRDRMAMMQQMQGMMAQNPFNPGGMGKMKQSTENAFLLRSGNGC